MEPHRRGRSLAGRASTDGDDGLDLFSRRRSTIPISNESSKLDRLLLGSPKIGRGGNDLLDADIGKHDYDWIRHLAGMTNNTVVASVTPVQSSFWLPPSWGDGKINVDAGWNTCYYTFGIIARDVQDVLGCSCGKFVVDTPIFGRGYHCLKFSQNLH